jgi:hypothetical protein
MLVLYNLQTYQKNYLKSLTSTVLITEIGETPYIPKPNAVTEGRKHKLSLATLLNQKVVSWYHHWGVSGGRRGLTQGIRGCFS